MRLQPSSVTWSRGFVAVLAGAGDCSTRRGMFDEQPRMPGHHLRADQFKDPEDKLTAKSDLPKNLIVDQQGLQ